MPYAQQNPDYKKLRKHALQKMDLVGVQEMISDFSGRQYLTWQQLQNQILPKHLTPQLAWAIVKTHRGFKKEQLPNFTKKSSDFYYNLTPSINAKLHAFDRKLAQPLCLINTDTKQHLLFWEIKEAINCCQLAGYNFSEKDGRSFLTSGRKGRKDWQIVLTKIHQQLKVKERKNLCLDGFIDLCQIFCLSQAAQPLRQNNGLNCCDLVYGHHFYEDKIDADDLQNGIANLLNWLNNNDKYAFTHPIIKAIYCHFWIVKSAPVYQHNGIIARLISNYFLLQKGYTGLQYLSLSSVINKYFNHYSSSFFYSLKDDGDLTYFIIFILNCVENALTNWELYINKKQKETCELNKFFNCKDCNIRQLSILKMLNKNPSSTFCIKDIENTFGVTYETARTDLLGLVEMGYLSKHLLGKKWVFWKEG